MRGAAIQPPALKDRFPRGLSWRRPPQIRKRRKWRRLSPVALPQSVAGADPSIIRIAKQDAPGLVVEDISGRPGSEIPLRIEVAQSDTEEYSFLMFRGLPAEISLSAGFRLKDSWAVSLRDLTNLALVSPPNYEARFQVEVLLIKGRNTPADSRVMSVSLQRAPAAAPQPAVAAAPRQEPAPQRILTAAPPEPQPQPVAAAKIEPSAPSLGSGPARRWRSRRTPRLRCSTGRRKC